MSKIQLPKYIKAQEADGNVLVHINTRHPALLLWFFREAMRQSKKIRLAITAGRFKVSLPTWPIALPLALKHVWQLATGDKLEKAI